MENVIVTAKNSFSGMVFLPPTRLIIDYYISKVAPESLSSGLQPPELWSFAAGTICIVLVCPEVLAYL
ncbi:MAG: hypothetical protein V7K73_05470 [Nostoc sp.]